jgi:hypothetical protein
LPQEAGGVLADPAGDPVGPEVTQIAFVETGSELAPFIAFLTMLARQPTVAGGRNDFAGFQRLSALFEPEPLPSVARAGLQNGSRLSAGPVSHLGSRPGDYGDYGAPGCASALPAASSRRIDPSFQYSVIEPSAEKTRVA